MGSLRDEVVMIGEDRPSFQTPVEFIRSFQQKVMKVFQSVISKESVLLVVGSGCHHVDPGGSKSVWRRVRPVIHEIDWLGIHLRHKLKSWGDVHFASFAALGE